MSDIKRYRGDTVPLGITVTQNNLAYDLTGCTLKLSISELENPTTEEEIIQQTVGVLDTDPTTGKAYFPFEDTDFDFLGSYFYDIELADSNGKKRTIIKRKVKITQDITK